MSENKHTMAPWVAVDLEDSMPAVRGPNGYFIATIHIAPNDAEKFANAHLIAAAPELLEELRSYHGGCVVCSDGRQCFTGRLIAKAEGKS